jgi:hypothetical protein
MHNRRMVLAILVFLAVGLLPLGAAGSTAWLARINAGMDVIDIGFAGGVGGGYRFGLPTGNMEVLGDVYYSPYCETYTEGANTFDYKQTLIIVAARANWLFNYTPEKRGLYPLVGLGFFAGSFSWTNYNRTTDYTEGNSYFASGTVINLGLGWAFTRWLEARFEVPVMVFFGEYGRAAAIAIPLTLSAMFRF